MRGWRLSAIGLFVIGAALASAAPAGATTGVSIDVSRIAISEALLAGDEYRLPAFGVRNPGTEPTSYRLTVSSIDGQAALSPPESWFSFAPGDLTLGPTESRAVQTRLVIPADAEPGEYAALIGPQIASDGGGAQIGAAAVARLTFTVVPSSPLEAFLRWLLRSIGENPWILLVPTAFGVGLALWFVRRRFAFSISRRA